MIRGRNDLSDEDPSELCEDELSKEHFNWLTGLYETKGSHENQTN